MSGEDVRRAVRTSGIRSSNEGFKLGAIRPIPIHKLNWWLNRSSLPCPLHVWTRSLVAKYRTYMGNGVCKDSA